MTRKIAATKGKTTFPPKRMTPQPLKNRPRQHLTTSEALQFSLAALSFGTTTAISIALAIVTFKQFEVSDRQVKLEYAKSSPKFEITAKTFRQITGDATSDNEFPSKVEVRLKSGEAIIKNIKVTQDFRAFAIKGNNFEPSCEFRINDYMPWSTSASIVATNRSTFSFINEFGPLNNHGILMYPLKTWVKITYEDVFGKDGVTLLSFTPIGAANPEDRGLPPKFEFFREARNEVENAEGDEGKLTPIEPHGDHPDHQFKIKGEQITEKCAATLKLMGDTQ